MESAVVSAVVPWSLAWDCEDSLAWDCKGSVAWDCEGSVAWDCKRLVAWDCKGLLVSLTLGLCDLVSPGPPQSGTPVGPDPISHVHSVYHLRLNGLEYLRLVYKDGIQCTRYSA